MLKKKAEKKDRNKRWRYKTTEQNKKHWFCIIRGMDDFFFFGLTSISIWLCTLV